MSDAIARAGDPLDLDQIEAEVAVYDSRLAGPWRERVKALLTALRDARQRVQELEEQAIAGSLTLDSLHIERGALDAKFGGRMAEIIADAMTTLFDEQGGKNYLEISLLHRATQRIFTLTMQLKGAKSPHELREAAEAALAAAAEREARKDAALNQTAEQAEAWLAFIGPTADPEDEFEIQVIVREIADRSRVALSPTP